MSLTPSAQRAIGWLEQQINDLGGIRNATPRDPSFKNWRQASLTVLQRIWPGDQDRSERFRRIPFSPVDPRADARTVREWYSRGCQEAARVLAGFIEDVRKSGVPDQPTGAVEGVDDAVLETDFPTVDLPAGNLSDASRPAAPAPAANTFSQFVDDAAQGAVPQAQAPPSLPSEIRPIHNQVATVRASDTPPPAPPRPASATAAAAPRPQEPPAPKKGVGARLKDLLGFAQLSAKALAGFPKDSGQHPMPHAAPQVPTHAPSHATPQGPTHVAPQSALPSLDAPMNTARPSMEVTPLGGAVANDRGRSSVAHTPGLPISDEDVPRAPRPDEPVPSAPPALAVPLPGQGAHPGAPPSGLWPLPRPEDNFAPPASPPAPVANTPPAPMQHEAGKSVVMSRPTLLRSAIEKVSIESLLSDQFRDPSAQSAPPAATPEAPGALEQMVNDMLTAETTASAPATPSAPAAPAAAAPVSVPVPPAAAAPPAAPQATQGPPSGQMPTIPLFEQVQTAPAPRAAAPTPAAPTPAAPAAPVAPVAAAPPAATPSNEAAETPRYKSGESRLIQMPPRIPAVRSDAAGTASESGTHRVDPEAFARATEDFMKSSPVLGATGRTVQRPNHEETGFHDPDAIAVASIVHDFGRLDVPAGRQAELRARLQDLARRIESGDLDWAALRKAVWFAMEYPELARRLMPVLLPWIDRAA